MAPGFYNDIGACDGWSNLEATGKLDRQTHSRNCSCCEESETRSSCVKLWVYADACALGHTLQKVSLTSKNSSEFASLWIIAHFETNFHEYKLLRCLYVSGNVQIFSDFRRCVEGQFPLPRPLDPLVRIASQQLVAVLVSVTYLSPRGIQANAAIYMLIVTSV